MMIGTCMPLTLPRELFPAAGYAEIPARSLYAMEKADFDAPVHTANTDGIPLYAANCLTPNDMRLTLPFRIGKNQYCKFPETGYSGQFGGQSTADGSQYDAAVSAAWVQDDKLLLYVQIIEDYLGNLLLELSFKGDRALVTAQKHAENFMNDYNGETIAVRSK